MNEFEQSSIDHGMMKLENISHRSLTYESLH